MQKRRALVLVSALVLFSTSSGVKAAAADETPAATTPQAISTTPTWEFSTSGNARISVEGDVFSKYMLFEVAGTAKRFFAEQWAVFARPALSVYHSFGIAGLPGAGNTTFSLRVGPEYNFSKDIANSFYLQAGVGFIHFTAFNTGAFLYSGAVGKRVSLGGRVTWSPELGISGNTSNGGYFNWHTGFSLTLLQFSMLF